MTETINFNQNRNLIKSKSTYQEKVNNFLRTKQAKAYTMLVLSLFTISFFGLFAIRPVITEITELKKKIDDAKTLNASLQDKIDTLIKAQQEYQLVSDFIPAIDEAIPQDPYVVQALLDLESLLGDKNATITSIQTPSLTYSPTTDTEGEKSNVLKSQETPVSMSITLKGNFNDLNEFAKKVLTYRRNFTASSYDIIPSQSEGEGQLKLSLKLNTYYLK